MSSRESPPFRADHVGSLLRPPEVARARADFKAGRIDAAALREVEDEAIRGVIELQRAAGLQTVTDGEFRRTSWAAMRVLLHRGGQQADDRRGTGQAGADRRDGGRGLGALTGLGTLARPSRGF